MIVPGRGILGGTGWKELRWIRIISFLTLLIALPVCTCFDRSPHAVLSQVVQSKPKLGNPMWSSRCSYFLVVSFPPASTSPSIVSRGGSPSLQEHPPHSLYLFSALAGCSGRDQVGIREGLAFPSISHHRPLLWDCPSGDWAGGGGRGAWLEVIVSVLSLDHPSHDLTVPVRCERAKWSVLETARP